MLERNLLLLSISFLVKQFFLFLCLEFNLFVNKGAIITRIQKHCPMELEEQNQWRFQHEVYDPLLLTDVSLQQQQSSNSPSKSEYTSPPSPPCLNDSVMVDPGYPFDDGDANEGRCMVGFSFVSPDLVISAESPDIPSTKHADSPELLENKCHQKMEESIELSLENGIDEYEIKNNINTPCVKFSTFCETFEVELSPDVSFELPPPPTMEDKSMCELDTFEDSVRVSQKAECHSPKDIGDPKEEGDYQKLLRDYKFQEKELTEMRRMLEELKRENQTKSRECKEAWKSLKELQNELMRKSMHVGSLAFAVEGQVKEKSRWFSSLRDMTRKLKIMKMEHIKLAEEAFAYNKCLADMKEMSSTIQSSINQQAHLHEDLKIKFVEGAKERKELYNKVLELKGNIRVFCRCRPLNSDEVAAGASMVIDFESAKDGELSVKSNGTRKTFKFDAVFDPQAEQADVLEDTAPFAISVLDGYNVCIFAYGQTGTGKTFTMEGTEEARGVNFRTLEELFRIIKEREKQYRYSVSVSVLEVYNEQIRDLLASGTQPGVVAKRLGIRQVGEGIHHVPGLVEADVSNMNEVWEVLQTGSNARVVGSTNANERSSRSHCIHCVMVKGENLLTGECTRSKLWLVDLAGSERIAKTEVQGERLKETQNINRSLSALGDVISALATKSPHIPFRNSKLTHLLQDSLGGDSKTLMFVQISPNENDLSETICSLNFASRVKGIEMGPAKRQLDTSEFLRYKQLAEKTKLDIKSKDVQIKKMEETVQGLELKMKEKDFKNKNLLEKVKELESQLLIERKLARQHVDTKIAEQQQQMKHQHEEQNTIPPMRPPLGTRPLVSQKSGNDLATTMKKELVNPIQPLMEKNSYKPPLPFQPMESFVRTIDPTEKENIPDMADHSYLPRRTGRASICTMTRQIPAARAPRRASLIPLPIAPNTAQKQPFPLLLLPHDLSDSKDDTSDGSETNCLPEQTPCDSPKVIRNDSRKLSIMFRRSIQKRVQTKVPMQQHMKKCMNVGVEKVRVSIGSRGRMAHRVLLGNGRRPGTKGTQKQQIQKEKERGWNILGKTST